MIIAPAITPDDQIALAAAHCAAQGTAEMLRFAREGASGTANGAFEPDTIELLADALRMAILIEHPVVRDNGTDPEGASSLNQLSGALDRFLEGWA